MHQTEIARLSRWLGRMLAGVVWVVMAGVAGAVGAAQAQVQLSFSNLAGGYAGDDGGPALNVNLHGIADVVRDASGNYYVSQRSANRIRKITAGGTITTIAGGNVGFGGDGGAATSALIHRPGALALDASGNLFFIDEGNRRVRRISSTGQITTVAGNGQREYNVDNTGATQTGLDPTGLAVDKNGNVFIADHFNHRIFKVATTGKITTFLGNGLSGSGGDGGPAANATVSWPMGMDFDANGNLYFTDRWGSGYRRVSTGGVVTRGATSSTSMVDIEVAGGTIWMTAANHCLLVKVVADSEVYFNNAAGACAQSTWSQVGADVRYGFGMTSDASGNVYFADSGYARLAKLAPATGAVTTIAGTRTTANGALAANVAMSYLTGLSVDDAGNVLIGDSASAFRVRKLTGGRVWNVAGDGSFDGPLACDRAATCLPLSVGVGGLSDVAWGPNGIVYVSDYVRENIYRIGADGKMVRYVGYTDPNSAVEEIGDGAHANMVRPNPRGLAVDGAGNLYFADALRNVIWRVNTAGLLYRIAGGGYGEPVDEGVARDVSLEMPTHLSIDGAGNLYFLERTGNIRKVTTDGRIHAFAGVRGDYDYSEGFSGEGGVAKLANLGDVTDIAAHSSGVYIASDGAIRRVRPDGRIETVKGLAHHAISLEIRRGYLYVGTESGRVLRAVLPRRANADFNGDRKADVFLRGTTGANTIWSSADAATKQTVSTYATENKLAGQGDFDGDGKADLVWRNTLNGTNTIWRSANATTKLFVAAMTDQQWKIAGVGDFNGDGKSDLFWRHMTTGANQVWLSGNSATKLAVSSLADMKWVVAGIGDFDGDAKSDVLWRNTTSGSNTIWSAANSGVRKPIAGVTNIAWKVAAVADVNGDGIADIVWRDGTTGTNAIWLAGNNTTQQPITAVTGTQWIVAGAGDYENDGIADLFWRNTASGANVIWKNGLSTSQRAMAGFGSVWQVQPQEAQP